MTRGIITDAYLVGEAMSLMHAERDTCGLCAKRPQEGPPHFCTHVAKDGNGAEYLYNDGCESNGRRYDPSTHELRGRQHCSCDVCF